MLIWVVIYSISARKIMEIANITVTLGKGKQVNAQFKQFTVLTDQSKQVGGEETAPDPFSYFLISLATCAGFFVQRFCQSREIATDGIDLCMSSQWNESDRRVEKVTIAINIPSSFPEKYKTALVRATNECTVKRALMNPPEIAVITNTKVTESA